MEEKDFIRKWEIKMENGKLKFILKRFLLFFALFFIIDLVIGKFYFGSDTLFDFFVEGNWNKVSRMLPIMLIGSLVCAWAQYWALNKQYERLKNDI